MRDKLFQGCDDPFHRAKALCQKPATHIPTMMNSYIFVKEGPKCIWITWHPLSSADISTFIPEMSKFCYIKIQIAFWHIISYSFNVSWDFLIGMVTVLIMSAKMAALSLLKIKVFQNKDYELINSVHDTSPTKFYQVTLFILYMQSYDQSLETIAFLWEKLS